MNWYMNKDTAAILIYWYSINIALLLHGFLFVDMGQTIENLYTRTNITGREYNIFFYIV